MAYTLQFVDSIVAAPGLRLALNNDQPWRVLVSGTDMSPPQLQRAVSGSLLADGQTISGSAYDNRVIQLHLQMQGTLTEDQAATYLQALARELDRPNNFLMYQPDNSYPVFFRTFRSDFGSVFWDPTLKEVSVRILAEPFAYGVEESATVTTVDGVRTDITNLKGDVETPLRITFGTSTTFGQIQALFATRRRAGGILVDTDIAPADWTTLGADTSVAGIGLRCTFATTTTMTARASGNLMPNGTVDSRGRYRVIAVMKKSVSGDTIKVRATWRNTSGSGGVDNTTVTLPSGTNSSYVDLGYVTVGGATDPVTLGYSGVDAAYPEAGYIEIGMERTAGSGNLDLGTVYMIPADDQHTILGRAGGAAIFSSRWWWDGPRGLSYYERVSGGVRDTGPHTFAGPNRLMASPGMTTRIWALADVTPAAAVATSPAPSAVTYWPRYLYVKPLAS